MANKPYRNVGGLDQAPEELSYQDLVRRNTGPSLASLDTAAATAVSVVYSTYAFPLTTKGDILGHDGSSIVRKAVGSNDQVLTADGSTTDGLRWMSLTTTKGDVLGHNGSDPIRQAVGDNGTALVATSSATNGLEWQFALGLWGIAEFGTGHDGAAIISGTTTLAANINAINYTTLTLESSATLRNATGSTFNGLVIFCSVGLVGTDSTSIITSQTTNQSAPAVNGAAGGGGGGAGGDAGRHPSSIFIYAKYITGTGLVSNSGSDGQAGANASAASATANGANGGNPTTAGTTIFNSSATFVSIGATHRGGGGLSNGTSGTAGVGASSNWNDFGPSSFKDMGAWRGFAGLNYSSASTTGQLYRSFTLTNGGGGGAGGRNNGGAQGGAGGGSGAGAMPWPVAASTVCQAGAAGGSGGAGGSGAGGGGGGPGATGGLIFIIAISIVSTWTFTANGGNGGNGGNGHGFGGGGAAAPGGDGGFIFVITLLATTATFNIAGGSAGSPGTAGASGGSAGGSSVAGRTGVKWQIASQAA